MAGDLNDFGSLKAALKGTTLLFAATNSFEPFSTVDGDTAAKIEATQGMHVARAAAEVPTLHHFVWSTLPSAAKWSDGKYSVPHFEGKHAVDEYIKTVPALLEKTTFLYVTWYAQNLTYPMFTPALNVSTLLHRHSGRRRD